MSGGIDDLCLKYFVEAGAMAVRRCKKGDLKRIARSTGGTTVVNIYFMITVIVRSGENRLIGIPA